MPRVPLQEYYERYGSEDGRFQAWRMEDVISLGASPVIFMGNILEMQEIFNFRRFGKILCEISGKTSSV